MSPRRPAIRTSCRCGAIALRRPFWSIRASLSRPAIYTPYFTSICGVDPCHIDQTSGWAYPGAGDQPFGASIAIYGVMPGQPLFVDPPAGLPVYQVTVQQIDTTTHTLIGSPQILTDPFPISILKQVGGGFPTATTHTQFAVGGFYTWQQMTPSAAGWNSVSLEGVGGGQGPLTVWNSVAEGTYLISVTAWNAAKTTSYPAGTFVCTSDGSTRQSVVIDLDQKPPVPDLQITGYKPGGVGPCISAVDCQTFTVGDVICGDLLGQRRAYRRVQPAGRTDAVPDVRLHRRRRRGQRQVLSGDSGHGHLQVRRMDLRHQGVAAVRLHDRAVHQRPDDRQL